MKLALSCCLQAAIAVAAADPDCGVGNAYNAYTAKCEAVPRWDIKGDQETTVCFDQTWNAKGDGFETSKFPTCATLSVGSAGMNVHMVAYNDNVKANAFMECGSDMWNQEVMEVFITNDVTNGARV
jgi:hypothetical protein